MKKGVPNFNCKGGVETHILHPYEWLQFYVELLNNEKCD